MATTSNLVFDTACWSAAAIVCPACNGAHSSVVSETLSNVYLTCDRCHHVWSHERLRTSPAFRITRRASGRIIVRSGAAA